MRRFALLLCVLTAPLEGQILKIRSEYLNSCYLASSQVNTPDPAKACFYGQDLVIHWRAPIAHGSPLKLHLSLFFGNWEREEVEVELTKCVGWWRYRLLGQDYDCRGGIIAYKAELYSGENLLETKCHPLWVEEVKPNSAQN